MEQDSVSSIVEGDLNLVEISIQDNPSVAILKERIKDKNKNGLKGIDAKNLILWKAIVPVGSKAESSCKYGNKLEDKDKISKAITKEDLDTKDFCVLAERPQQGIYLSQFFLTLFIQHVLTYCYIC